MPWSGGTFTPLWSWVVDAVTFPNILPSRFDTYEGDQASGINNCLTKDGQNQPTANLPMAGFIHTGVGNGGERNQYPAIGQIQDGSLVTAATDSGAADAYAMTLSPAITAYAEGQLFWLQVANANTGASTLNVNSLGAKSIKVGGTTDVSAGQILANTVYGFYYDGTNFQLISQSVVVPDPVTEFPDDEFRVVGSSDDTKKLAFEVDGITASTTRTVTVPNKSGTMAMTSDISPLPNNGQRSNKYYTGGIFSGGGSNLTVTANRLYAMPFIIGSDDPFDTWLFRTGPSASGNARGGIYEMTNGVPGALILDFGQLTGLTTGAIQTLAITLAQNPGAYFLASVFSGTPQIETPSTSNDGLLQQLLGGSFESPDTFGYYTAHTFGALPDPFGTPTEISAITDVPFFMLKAD